MALFGADHLQRQVDRRMTLHAQQQAVRAIAQARQVEQKLWIGLATFGEWTFCAAVQRAERLLAIEQPDLQIIEEGLADDQLQAFGWRCLQLHGEPPGAACIADAGGALNLAALLRDALQYLAGAQLAAGVFQQQAVLDAHRRGQIGSAELE